MANEKRLIDADALEQHCKNTKIIELFPEWKGFPYEMKIALIRYGNAWKEIIQNTPTVDAVEVVRCGECRFVDTDACPMSGTPGRVSASDFCSYGERRTNVQA